MEQELHPKPKQITVFPNDFEILHLIQTTYQSKNTAQIASAQSTLGQLLGLDKFIEKLFEFLENQQQLNIQKSQQFKMAVSILIKKFSYQFSKKQNANKEIFVDKLYQLLVSKLNVKAKQQLGTAFEYILNEDTEQLYKPKVCQKIAQILQSEPDNFALEGNLIMSNSCLNSLIEAQDQFNFIWTILDSLVINATNIMQFLKKQPVQTLSMEDNIKLIKLSKRIFDLMELAFSRILDEEDLISDKVDDLRNHPSLQILFYCYLANFSYRKSILSTIPQINAVKQLIVEIIFGLYRDKPMPQNIFNLFFITLLIESERQSFEEEQQHIISRNLELMQIYLENKFYIDSFMDHKMQLMISMMSYSVTKPQQFDMIEQQPEKFIELSEQFTQAFKDSVQIKVRAAAFLRVFTAKFDQALKNILQIVVIIVTANMETDDANSPCYQLYQSLQQQFPQFQFFKIRPELHLEVCFNILSLLSPFISRRQDLNKIVYAVLVTHLQKFQKIQKPVVILRLIRLIGYYPTAVYYNMIKSYMSLGKVFILEGLKSFERILKANKYVQIYDVLAQIFVELINVISINDTIFQTIILNHYERVLKKNVNLYNQFLIKIRDTFIENIDKNKQLHYSFVCLSYIYSMLGKENQSSYRQKILEYFYSMEEYYNKVVQFYTQKVAEGVIQNANQQSNKQVLKTLSSYEQKIIDIYSISIRKQSTITLRMINFSKQKLKHLNQFNRNEQIFKLYNNLFLKIDNDFEEIYVYYEAFMNALRDMCKPFINNVQNNNTQQNNLDNNPNNNHQIQANSRQTKLQILPNICYLLSQIFACFYQIHLGKNDIVWMVNILGSLTHDLRQYILLIILSYAYVQPLQFKQTLQLQNLYQQTLKFLLTTQYNEKLIRKIFLLAMSKLLEIEDIYFQDIIKQCIKYFKEQFQQHQTKKKRKQHQGPKLRHLFQEDKQQSDEQHMVQEKKKGSSQLTIMPEFKHPYAVYSQYDQFKVKIWQNNNVIEKLNENDKNQLREILRMDWFGKGVRKIVQVKHNF